MPNPSRSALRVGVNQIHAFKEVDFAVELERDGAFRLLTRISGVEPDRATKLHYLSPRPRWQ